MIGKIVVIAICLGIAGAGYFAPGAVNLLFDLFDLILGWMGPFMVVTIISALTGVLFILAFPHVSAQGAIVAVKDRIKHNLLGIRIFQDDMPTVGRGVLGSMGWNLGYIGLNILPMIVLAAPFMVVWFSLNSLYAFQPLKVGDETTIVAELADKVDASKVQVELPAGLELLRRGNTDHKVVLKVRTLAEGAHEVVFRNATVGAAGSDNLASKTLEVGTTPKRLARLRTATPFTKFAAAQDPILFFGDPLLPANSFIQTIQVPYAVAPLGFMSGGEISIMLWFVLVSMIVGFGLKGFFGVEI
jgi:hypothetical protein